MGKVKKLFRWSLFLIIALIGLELLVRLVLYVSLISYLERYIPPPYTANMKAILTDFSLYKFDPFSYRRPRDGFFRGRNQRYTDYPQKKEKGEIRILCVGDSTTYGIAVNYKESWPHLLELLLREKYPDKNIRVLNAGFPGFSSREIKRIYQLYLVNYHPDIVIFKVALEGLTDRYKLPQSSNFVLNLIRHWLIYCLYESRIFRVVSILVKTKNGPLIEKVDDFITYKLLHINKRGQKFDSDWSIVKKISLENGIKYILVLDELFIQGNTISTNYPIYERIAPENVLRTYDAFKDRLATTDIKKIFVDKGGHMTEIGTAIIAEEIFKYLIAKKWIEGF